MKNNKYIFLLSLIFPILVSCGGKGKDLEKLRSQYIEACSERDFEKARALAEKASLLDEDYFGKTKHVKYVNDKEIYFLLADNSRDNSDRIMYMFNSIDKQDLPDMRDVLEVATSQGNEYLAIRLVQGGVKANKIVAKGAISHQMDELLALLLQNDPNLISDDAVYSYAEQNPALKELAEKNKEAFENKLKEQEEAKLKKEKEEFDNKIKEVIANKIPTRPATGIVKSDSYGQIRSEYTEYNDAVESHNSKCKDLLYQAIKLEDWKTANQLVNAMKPELEWNAIGDWAKVVEHTDNSSVYEAYKVAVSNTAINEAKTILKNAH